MRMKVDGLKMIRELLEKIVWLNSQTYRSSIFATILKSLLVFKLIFVN
jgi:hypothetical protein